MNNASSQLMVSKASWVLLPILGIATPATGAIAQVIPAEDGTQTAVDVEDNFINITGGQHSAGNLFHSFDTFDITHQETTNFVTQSEVLNIVGRINSSNASTINGTLQVEGSNANLYLMNPAGILIGPDAQLNLAGGFTATTATSIGFESGQFNAGSFNDYSSLSGEPNAFYFEAEQPGAVVNLGDLTVQQGESLSLMGGTVVNDGSLSAPEGNLIISAVEGGNVVRLSQENQLLSLEIEESDLSFNTITPATIGQMLTGGELASATALTIENGSVRLGDVTIDESGGNAVISQSLSSTSERANHNGNNVVVVAADDIIITNPTDRELSFTSGSSLSFIADADSNGTGQFLMNVETAGDGSLSGDAIDADSANIFISGAGIVVGSINTDLITNEGKAGGNITLNSSRDVSALSLSTNSYSFEDNPGNGGDVSISADNGDIDIANQIKTWSWAVGSDAVNQEGKGGDITLEAEGGIFVGSVLNSGSIAVRTNNKAGGAIALTAQTGDISVNAIDTRSVAYTGEARAGGTVSLIAPSGSVNISSINSTTLAGTAGTQNGGTVDVRASDITISDINSRIGQNSGDDGSGDIFLTANNLTVGSILAIASQKNQSGRNIQLTADNLSFTGGDRSIRGETIQISTASDTRNIRVGTEQQSPEEGSALDISKAALDAISQRINQFIIGSADSEGTVSILPGAIRSVGNRAPISIAGGQSLIGPNEETRYTLTGTGAGYIEGADIGFSDIGNLIGGELDDTFTFAEGVSLEAFESIDGGLGINTIESEGASENGSVVSLGTINLFGIDKLSAPSTQSTLQAGDQDNEWVIDGINNGYLNGLRFEGFQTLIGGNKRDRFRVRSGGFLEGALSGNRPEELGGEGDYANVKDILQGTNEGDVFEITGDRTGKINSFDFFDIEAIDGQNGTDTLTLSALEQAVETSDWVINREGSNTVNGLEFEDFETLIGSGGQDTFDVNGLDFASDITIDGGSDQGNRIVTDSLNTTWAIGDETHGDGTNKGALHQAENTLLSFRDIQNIQNDSENSQQHTVAFLNDNSQITGSIDGGMSDLLLIGDDINLGNNFESNNVGAKVFGSGKLTIRPSNQAFDIELGGTDGGSSALNITAGELEAIQDGFIEIEIGGTAQSGEVRLVGDAEFKSGVVVRSQTGIDTSGHQLTTASGNIAMQTEGFIRSDRITARNGSVRLQAQQDIETGAIAAQSEQGISLTSESGSITVNGDLDSTGDSSSGDINLSAGTDIISGDINTTSEQHSGDVTIFSATGGITTGGITTANGNRNDGVSPRSSGSVSLNSEGSINIEFIDARGSENTEETTVAIATSNNFRATGSINNPDTGTLTGGASISTRGTEDGSVRISYGRTDRIANLFQIGHSAENGTAFRIEAPPKTAIIAGNFLSNYKQSRIELFNRGRLPAGISEATANQATITTYDIPNVQPVTYIEEETTSLFQQIEARNSENFENYLGIIGSSKASQSLSLQETQDALKEIAQSTETQPAVVYVYFVPDAASESSVKVRQDKDIQPDDQLEIMVITADGTPTRKRRWGITRTQVDEANRTLRHQATSQFSTPQQYLPPAQQLYDWIVEPIAQILGEQDINSLGFVMDTGLRTLPVAALHDGDRYLVENYSLGLLPSIGLSNIKNASANRADLNEARILAMGASRFDNQPNLPAVEAEVALIEKNNWVGDTFLNEDFVLKTLQNQLQKEDYDIVHLATHAVFKSGDLENSYIQLWDEKLSLNNIGSLQLDQENLSMIILSACNTAIGDLQAEYGFAGFAVSAGSQSALASLWPVNDEGTLGFMTQFYDQLQGASIGTSALQQAQVSLINGEVRIEDGEIYGPAGEVLAVLPNLEKSGRWDFSHPFYWSTFTMIGNPW